MVKPSSAQRLAGCLVTLAMLLFGLLCAVATFTVLGIINDAEGVRKTELRRCLKQAANPEQVEECKRDQ